MLAELSFVLAMAGGPPKWMKVFAFADIKLGREKLTSVERRIGSGNEAGGQKYESRRLWKVPNDPLWQLELTSERKPKTSFVVTGVSLSFKNGTTKDDLAEAKIKHRGFWTAGVLKLKRPALVAKLQSLGMEVEDRDYGMLTTMVYDHFQYMVFAKFDATGRTTQVDLNATYLSSRR